MIAMADRYDIMHLLDKACEQGARLAAACRVLGISARTVQRWRLNQHMADGRIDAAKQRIPANKLTEQERRQIVAICNQPEFASMPASQIVPALADRGVYVASEASFYRVLRQAGQAVQRGKARAPVHKRPEPIKADAPNELWSWDITYLPTVIKGLFFYLYMIMDVYSRKIVGWEVNASESADHAAVLIRKAHLREGIAGKTLVLHSDNGAPMKGATMLATLQKLGVVPSFSRPSVSNDNAYSEALFKTVKYHGGYPDRPFADIHQARIWVSGFVHWYNEIHRHSALRFVTPAQRHRQEDIQILARRNELYETAKKRRPERWRGAARNWQPIAQVFLNPNRSSHAKADRRAA
jgi:transposase InsO family protein